MSAIPPDPMFSNISSFPNPNQQQNQNNNEINDIKRNINLVKEPSSILGYIKDLLYGKGISDRTAEIDDALARISGRVFDKDPRNYADLLMKTISSTLGKEDIEELTNYFLFEDKEIIDRFKRYINYEEIVENITFCGRALKVLSDSIISPDDVYKRNLKIESKNELSDIDSNQMKLIENIIDVLEIEDKLWTIVYETLKNGDFFIEITDYKSKEIPISQVGLFERESKYGKFLLEDTNSSEDTEESLIINENNTTIKVLTETNNELDIKININLFKESIDDNKEELDANSEEKEEKEEKEDIYNIEIKNTELQYIRLLLHEPWRVIKIQSKRFRTCLGYLVLPEIEINDLGVEISGFSGQTRNVFRRVGRFLGNRNTGNEIISGVDNVYKDMIEKIKKYLKNNDIYISKSEVKGILDRLVNEVSFLGGGDLSLKVRYVPVDRMEHFLLPSSKYFPYGSSIFNKVLFLCKLLISLETAAIVKRVSDSIDKRVIYIESGIKRDARDIIETVKEALLKRKFFLNSSGTIGSIPSMLSNHEIIAIPTSKGRRVIEFDTLSSPVRIDDLSNELNFLRDSIIAGLDVPPSYLNIEENVSNRTTLAFENILFAQTVCSYQNIFSKHLTNLIKKILFLITGKKMSKTIKVSFYPPRMLQMERDAEKYEIANRIITTLSELGIPKEYLIKKYIDINEEEIENYKNISSIKDKMKPMSPEGEPPMGSGMGMMPGGIPPGF